jgi:hypothetical protein
LKANNKLQSLDDDEFTAAAGFAPYDFVPSLLLERK